MALKVKNSYGVAPREGAHLDGGIEIDFDGIGLGLVRDQTPFALAGGVFSSLTGSGSDVLLFVFVVLAPLFR